MGKIFHEGKSIVCTVHFLCRVAGKEGPETSTAPTLLSPSVFTKNIS
jgi:hypothetical protein